MSGLCWRARAGLVLVLFSAFLLFFQLASPPGPPASGGPAYFDLRLMGRSLLRIPASGEGLAAALRAKRFFIAPLPLAGGTFLLFLDTEAGGRLEKFIRDHLGED